MSHYLLKVITKAGEQTIQLSGETVILNAEENTVYQIFNEQGELIAQPNVTALNQSDAAIYLTSEAQPSLILEGYYNYYPLSATAQLNEISATLATTSQETPFVLASEVIRATTLPNMMMYGLGATALLGGTVAMVQRNDSSEPSNAQEPSQPVPTVVPEPINVSLTLNPISADNRINLSERVGTVVVSGEFSSDQVVTGANVTLEIGGAHINANVQQSSFSAEVSGALLAQHNSIKANITVENTQSKGSAELTHTYENDFIIAHPTITFSDIASDNIVNLAESRENVIKVRGQVTNVAHSEAKEGDNIVITIGDQQIPARLKNDLSFEIDASGELLSKNSKVSAVLETRDTAGNTLSTTQEKTYSVDTEITHPTITFSDIATDNIVNLAESREGVIKIRGQVTNVANSEAKEGDNIVITIGDQQIPTRLKNDLSFEIDASGELLSKNSNVSAVLETRDTAGNTLSTTQEKTYSVDTEITHPTITFSDIATDNIVNLAESREGVIKIRGQVTNVASSEAKEGDNIVITIGDKQIPARLKNDLSFEIDASGELLSKNSKVSAVLETRDTAGNTLSTTQEKTYSVDTEITHPTITFSDIATDNIVNLVESRESVIKVRGQVTNVANSEAKEGDNIVITIGDQQIPTRLKNDLSFEIDASGELLSKNSKVSAVLETRDTAGNTLSTTQEKSYDVDLIIAEPTITVNDIARDNTINLRESGDMLTVSGSVVNGEGAVAKPRDKVVIQIGDSRLNTELDDNLNFSLEVSGQLLAESNQLVVSLATQDPAQNRLVTNKEKAYLVDKVITDPKIVINSIAKDDILNARELTEKVEISGSVENIGDSAAKKDDLVVLEIGTHRIETPLDEQLRFSVEASNEILKDNRRIDLTLHTEDPAGNRTQTQSSRDYRIDKEIFHPKIHFEAITTDNTINQTEGANTHNVVVNGRIENVNGSEAKPNDKIILTVGRHEVEARLTDGLRFSAPISGEHFINDDRKLSASLSTSDPAGNELVTRAEHDYFIDQVIADPTIIFEPITLDNIVNIQERGEKVIIRGQVENPSNAEAKATDKITVTIGSEVIEASLKNDLSFEVEASGELLSKNSKVSAVLETRDTAGNTLSTTQEKTYSVDTEIAHPTITFNEIATDNIVNLLESRESVIKVRGQVTNAANSEAKEGDNIVITIGDQQIPTRLKNDLSFEIDASGELLSKNSKVSAVLETRDTAGNTLSTTQEKSYDVDLIIAEPTITVNDIARDNTINLRESGDMQTVSGSVVNGEGAVAKPHDKVVIQIGDSRLNTELDDNLNFSLEVSGQLLAESNQLVVSLATQDSAQNNLVTEKAKTYLVDKVITDPKIVINSIAKDDILNARELTEKVEISGSVENIGDSAAKKDDLVVLEIGTHRIETPLDEQLRFSVEASNEILKDNRRIDLTLHTEDPVGNRTQTQSSRDYRIDKEIFHPKIHFDAITTDNTINQTEGANTHNVVVNGRIENVNGSEAKPNDKIILTVGRHEVEARLTDGLNFSASISGEHFINSDRKLTASLSTSDPAGNELVTRAEHDYFIDQVIADPTIIFEPITPDNIVNIQERGEKVIIRGQVENPSNAEAKATDKITVTIGSEVIEESLKNDLSFEVEASGELLSKNSKVSAVLETRDTAGNTLSTTQEKTYSVDTEIAHPTITFNEIATDNIVNLVESRENVIKVGGRVANVANSEAKEGDNIVITIGDQQIPTRLKNDLSFEIDASGELLSKNSKVSAVLETRDTAGNTLSTTQEKSYDVDLIIAEPTITVNDIARDNTINLRESGDMLTVSGSVVNGEGAVAKPHDKVVIQIGDSRLNTELDDNLNFSLEVSGQLLAESNKFVVSLATQDSAQNNLVTEKAKTYLVDKVITDPKIVINSIAKDDILNARELTENVLLSGSVENVGDSAAKKGDVVVLEIGTNRFEVQLDDQLHFSKEVSGETLKDHNRIDLTLSTEDQAGNRTQTQSSRDYRIDKEIFHPKIHFEAIAVDNTINQAEGVSSHNVVVNGHIENVSGSEAKVNDKIILTVGGHEVEAHLTDGLRFSAPISGEHFINDDRKLSASLSTSDPAGNELVTRAEHDYFIDQVIADPTIIFEPITLDNIVNIQERGEKVIIRGQVENPSNAEAKATDKITVTIGSEVIKASLKNDLSFEVEASGELLSKNSKVSAVLETRDTAGNTLSTTQEKTYSVDTEITHPTITFSDIASDNIVNLAESRENVIKVRGQVTNVAHSEAKEGDNIVITIGDQQIPTRLKNDLSFEIDASGELLSKNSKVSAVLETRDTAGNTLSTTQEKTYSVDTEITHPTITFSDIATDNIVNLAESREGVIKIRGQVTNVANSEAKEGDNIVITIGDQQIPTRLKNDLSFEIDASGELLSKNSNVSAVLETRDTAGNTLSTTQEKTYSVDTEITHPTITFSDIATDNIVNLAESREGVIKIRGQVTNVANSEAKEGDNIVITIGDQQIPTRLKNDLSFEIDASGELLSKNSNVSAVLETRDTAGNTLSTTQEKTYSVDTEIAHPTITFSDIATDNIVNLAESREGVIKIRGQVTNVANSEAKEGDNIVITIGDQQIPTRLKNDLSFEIDASGELLSKNSKVSAVLETRDTAGNTLSTTQEKSYDVDLIIAEPTITVNDIARDNTINLRESGDMLTVSGSVVNGEGAVAKPRDKVVIQIGDSRLNTELDDNLNFSLEVSGQLLAESNQLVVSLATQDPAQNRLVTNKEKAYLVDKVITDPKIVINSIAKDDILNARELTENVLLSGSVENVGDSAAKKGDLVVLEIGTNRFEVQLDDQLHFSKEVSGETLKDHNRIDLTLHTEDPAGNRKQTQSSRDYRIDKEIFHPKIHFEAITTDNTINQTEGANTHNVVVNGRVENVNGSEAKPNDKIILTVGRHEVEARLTDGLRFSAPISGEHFINDDRKLSASLSTSDPAGNELVTRAEHDYFIDQVIADPTIIFEPITPDNIVNIQERGEKVIIRGQVENPSNAEAKATDKITLTIGTTVIDAFLQSDLSFSAEVDGSLLAEHRRIEASLSTEDRAQNRLTTNKAHDYRVDTDIAAPTLIIDPIATDNILNAVEMREPSITITGSAVNGQFAEAKQGDIVVLQIGQLRVEGRLDSTLNFSIPVSTIALINHKLITATLVTSDEAKNSATATENRQIEVDDTFALSVQANDIALDNIVNRVESEQTVTLTGSYTADSDLKAGSVSISVMLNGQARQARVNETDKTWSLDVEGADLVLSQGERTFNVTISAQDNAGNEKSETVEHKYRVDTEIEKPVIRITSIAGDDVIDTEEAKGSITITGIVENYEGNNPVILLCPCTACASGWKEVEATVVDGKFKVEVLVSETSLANAKLKSNERIVKAKYTAKDTAGNEAVADEASRPYEVEPNNREVNITKIGKGFDMSSGATTRISGTIETFGSSNARFDDIYNLGQNSRLVRMVKMVIGDKTYKVGFNGVTKSFYADIPNTELAALSGKSISLDFSDTFSTGINFYAAVFPMLTLIRNGAKVSDFVSNVAPTAKNFTLESDVLVKNGDNSYSIKEIKPQMTEISGTVKGDIAVGAEIEVKVGDFTTTTVVKEGKVFSVEVEDRHLKNNTAQVVTATLKNSGSEVVTDSEVYILPKAVSSNFVSQHTEVPVSARKMDHTKDDYNFFYPIHLMETETTKRGALKNVAVGGTETPFVYKYHFLRTDEIASLPTNRVQGAVYNDRLKESEQGSIKEVTDLTKEMFRHAYKKLSEYTNIRFEEVNSWQEANGNNSELGTGTDGTLIFMSKLTGIYANAAAIGYQGGNVVWNETISGANPQTTDYNHYLALHEIMHTLNLRHAHESFSGLGRNAISGRVPAATAENHISEASGEFSHMSYWNVATAMGDRDMRLYDLAYLHYRFGVNREHRAGDDVYTFKTYDTRKVDGDVYIWDGNGVDTFDASAEKEGVTVNLTPGSWNYRGTERKFNFLSDGRDIYDRYSYFGLDSSETIGGRVRNSFTERFNPLPDGANQVEIKKYQEGQSFIGYGTQIENLIGSKFDDNLTGNNADNNIFGGNGVDTIAGGAGDDFINGGEGNDLMFGNAGNDVFVVDSLGDVVTEKANEGEADHIYSFINYELENDEDSHIENLTLVGTTANQATGNALDNIIRSNDTGNTLNGMDGNDTLIGGLGKDTLTGGNGNDTFVFESSLNGKADTITDFIVGQDKIKLSSEIFSAINSNLSNLKDHLFYDATSGELSYNSSNSGADSAVHFVTVAGLQNLDGDKFIIG